MPDGITVDGLGPMMAALKTFAPEVAVALKAELKKAGDLVRADAEQRFDAYDGKSALGYRVYLRAGGSRVDVEQSLGRVTGRRPDYGALQMRRALLPALADKKDELFATADRSIAALGERI